MFRITFRLCTVFFHFMALLRVARCEKDIELSETACWATWNSTCSIECHPALEDDMNEFMSEYAEMNPHCAFNGYAIQLSGIEMVNAILNFNWLPPQTRITNLTLEFVAQTQVGGISSDSFDSVRFDSVEYLHIVQMKGNTLAAELIENTLLPNVKSIQIKGYFKDAIQEITFHGLATITHLNLSSCQIERIAPKAFDNMLMTLVSLDVSNNLLKTIAIGVFSSFASHHVSVRISNNPWDCNCALGDFQKLVQLEWFEGSMECASPHCLTGQQLALASLCDAGADVICPSTDLQTRQTANEADAITKECYDDLTKTCEEVQIKGQTKIRSFSYEPNGEIQIDIDNEYEARSLVVIWFETIKTSDDTNEYYESSETVICQSSETDSFRIRNLSPDTAYTVCVVSKTETTISPLDCFPYYNQTVVDLVDEDIWILEEDKVKVISFVVCGAIASLLFGLAMSFVLIRKNPAWLRGNDRVVRMSKDANSDVMIMPPEWSRQTAPGVSTDLKQRRFSDISIISGKSYVINANSANELYKRKLMEKRLSQNTDDIENKYYLDYLPHKIPPPLPPPNVPSVMGRSKSTSGAGDDVMTENYYSDLSFKNKHVNTCD